MAIKIDMLRYFVEVARAGNLAQAANILGRTPSALSMMLKQLEENLQAPLFETDRKTKLTPLGKFIYNEAQRDLEQLDRTVHSIHQFARSPGGYIRLAAVPSAASKLLPAALAEFQSKFPNVLVELKDQDSQSIFQELLVQKLDLALISNLSVSVSKIVHSHDVFEDRVGILFPSPMKEDPDDISWDIVSAYPFIKNHLSSSIKCPELKEVNENARFSVRNTSSLIAMVRAGLGITVLPELACKDIDDGVQFVIPKGQTYYRKIQVIWLAEKPLVGPARELLEIIKKI